MLTVRGILVNLIPPSYSYLICLLHYFTKWKTLLRPRESCKSGNTKHLYSNQMTFPTPSRGSILWLGF